MLQDWIRPFDRCLLKILRNWPLISVKHPAIIPLIILLIRLGKYHSSHATGTRPTTYNPRLLDPDSFTPDAVSLFVVPVPAEAVRPV